MLLGGSCCASKCSHCTLLLLVDWINSIHYCILCSVQHFPVMFFKWMRWQISLPHRIFHILQLTTSTILYKFSFGNLKINTQVQLSLRTLKKNPTLSWAWCVWVLCHISQPQKELITGILGALMASPPWCSLSKVHPAISSELARDAAEHHLVESCWKPRQDPVPWSCKTNCWAEPVPPPDSEPALYSCHAPLYASLQELPVFMWGNRILLGDVIQNLY